MRFAVYLAQPIDIEQTTSGVELGVESGVESEMAIQVLIYLKNEILSKKEIAQKLGKAKPTRYLNDLMRKLVKDGFAEYTISEKPNSRLQKYRLTDKGKKWLAERSGVKGLGIGL